MADQIRKQTKAQLKELRRLENRKQYVAKYHIYHDKPISDCYKCTEEREKSQ